MTPAAAAILSVLCAIVMFAPRRYALLAIFAAILFLSQRGGIDVGGLRIHSGRFLELAGALRFVLRREFTTSQFGQLDRAVLITYGFVTLMFLVRTLFGFGTSSSIQAITPVSKVGDFVDFLLMYVTLRSLVRSLDDVRWVLSYGLFLLVPLVGSLAVERLTLSNPLAVLGSTPTVWIDDVDGGRIRCYGAFAHPALLGTAGAWLAIAYVGLALSANSRKQGIFGIALCLAVVLLANSGGPLTSLMVGMLGWACWWVRDRMSLIRRGLVAALILLALVMKDPIWYLPSKMSILFGGSGWHRSYLMDQAIRHLGQWWVAGMPLELTVPWFPYLVNGAADMTNLYLAFGVDGGLGSMVLLVWLLVTAFKQIGYSLSVSETGQQRNSDDQLLVWALGCGIAVHAANYLSITYFDQTNALWLFQLAAIAAAVGRVSVPLAETTPKRKMAAQTMRPRKHLALEGRPAQRSFAPKKLERTR